MLLTEAGESQDAKRDSAPLTYKGFRKDTRFNDMNYIKMAIKDNNTHFS